ncbi:hypothetical protein J4226_00735 [Candidatus Pacearchaeota archaeon]|nr:hypothetical protein [Candidatus Pacearchaeota archaeon]
MGVEFRNIGGGFFEARDCSKDVSEKKIVPKYAGFKLVDWNIDYESGVVTFAQYKVGTSAGGINSGIGMIVEADIQKNGEVVEKYVLEGMPNQMDKFKQAFRRYIC